MPFMLHCCIYISHMLHICWMFATLHICCICATCMLHVYYMYVAYIFNYVSIMWGLHQQLLLLLDIYAYIYIYMYMCIYVRIYRYRSTIHIYIAIYNLLTFFLREKISFDMNIYIKQMSFGDKF